MIQFSCECGRQLQANDEDAGRQTKCPGCGRVNVIPRQDAIVGDESPPSARRERPRREAIRSGRAARDYEEDEDDRPAARTREVATGTSGKAIAALILGLLSFPCLIGNAFLSGLAAIVFACLALGEIGRSRGRLGGKGLAITGLIAGSLGCVVLLAAVPMGLLLPAVQKVREAAARTQDQNNLKQFSLAMHNFASTYNGGFPQAAAFRAPDGTPLLSWRVAILPYIEQDYLYKQFHLDEPWDSPHNKSLLPMMPKIYLQPGEQPDGSGLTRYQVLVGRGTIFEDPRKMPGGPGQYPLFRGPGAPLTGIRIGADIPDGTSNTILIATADQPVPWTKPEDMPYDPSGPLPVFSKRFSTGFNVAVADGSVRFLDFRISQQTLRNAITRNDGQVLGPDW
jgi:hypothetical protein